MAPALRLVSSTEIAPAPREEHSPTPEPACGSHAAAWGLGVPLGILVGLPLSLAMHGLIWLALHTCGVL
ncbi:hypothetical protein ACLBYG_22060 [Methylobacterium sp. D53M]